MFSAHPPRIVSDDGARGYLFIKKKKKREIIKHILERNRKKY